MANRWKVGLLLAAMSLPVQATAQQPFCEKRAVIFSMLDVQFNESPIAAGIMANGRLLEVLTSRDGSTWSIVVTAPSGVSCVVASGDDWVGRAVSAGSRI